MKRSLLLIVLVWFTTIASGQLKPFRFAFISDTHIGSPNGGAEEDLRRTVADINAMSDIAFVVITGDITELGTDAEIILAKQILDELKVPYYIIPGNHDSGWSESGGMQFAKVFGYDKFVFEYQGIHFLGCASGPYVRMSDGHIPQEAVRWMDSVLKKIGPDAPLVFLNHYPLDNGLDNWYEAIDRLKQQHTIAALCGHGHSNRALNFEGIPAVMGRSNLRAKAEVGGYNLVDLRADSMVFSERRPGIRTLPSWTALKIERHVYTPAPSTLRPSYQINDSFPQVRAIWTYASHANIISTPGVGKGLVIFGNSLGEVQALSMRNGKKHWMYQTGNAIYSSPAISGNKVVLGSADGYIYCLDLRSGKLFWRVKTNASVLGSPLIREGRVYIGGSDHRFRALDLDNGQEIWVFDGLEGPVVSTPVYQQGTLVFGAWDTHLYALDAANGQLRWKWNNGSRVINFSPASCIPVIQDEVVYIVAPDRALSAIDLVTGKTLWRSKEGGLRESIGISADGKYVYGKSMNDSVVAFRTSRNLQAAAWKMFCGFGYEHVPSMLIEKSGTVFFGTKNGRVYAINPLTQKRLWVHKIDNSMVNTVRVIRSDKILAATMDGKLSLLELKK